MAAHNIGVFEDGNSSSHTQTTNSNTPPFTRAIRKVVSFCKLRRIVVVFLKVLWLTFSVDVEFRCVLEKILTDRNRNSQKRLHPCESRCLRLKFSHEVAPVVYTGECIFPNGTKLELVDAVTGQEVRLVPLASAQVEIFLLNDGKQWTTEELNNHITMQGKGRKSGRDHNRYLRLEGGVVSVNEIKFKYTPKHMKKLKVVHLGARIVDQPEEIKVIEAVAGPFTVKDKRLKSKKLYPPSPTDDVWRLEHIYRNGAFHKQLTKNGIKTVEDFLIELQNNPQRLRQILGKSMSENFWKKVTMHAKTCNLDGRKYSYHHLEISGQKFTVVFNVAGQVMWLDSGYGLHPFNLLSESQKDCAHKLVETAFANWKNVEKSDNEISVADHLSPSKLEDMSGSLLGNLITAGECKSLEFQKNTSGTTERVDRAECSTSYAIAKQQLESEKMSLVITSGHSGLGTWGYLESPNNNTSVISESGDWKEIMQSLCPGLGTWGYLESPNNNTSLISESGDWKEIMQSLCPYAIQLDDFPYDNNSAAETSCTQFHEMQHGEMTQNQSTQFMVSENVANDNQQRQINNVLMVPEASTTCKGKYKKSWAKISSIMKWLLLKRFVKHKRIRMTKKRKLSST